MQIYFDSIDSLSVSGRRYGRMEADIDIAEAGMKELIRDIGAKTCVEALDDEDVYEALGGWESVSAYFAEEVEALIASAKNSQ